MTTLSDEVVIAIPLWSAQWTGEVGVVAGVFVDPVCEATLDLEEGRSCAVTFRADLVLLPFDTAARGAEEDVDRDSDKRDLDALS